MSNRDALIEAMARAMCVYQDQDPDDVLGSVDRNRAHVIVWTHWKGEATAALAALEAAGVRLEFGTEKIPMSGGASYGGHGTGPVIEAQGGAGHPSVFRSSPYAPKETGGE